MPAARHPVVLSIGGSVLMTGQGDVDYLKELARLLKDIGARHPLLVVVGGGRTAREYIDLGRSLALTEIELDELGIDVTRLHARLLSHLVAPSAPPHPPTTVTSAVGEIGKWPVVVMGGTEPGHTTDAVAALLAERLRAERLVNATSVAGIFDTDPRTNPAAKRLPLLDFATFRKLVQDGTVEARAGQQFPFDRLGAERLVRAQIPLAIVAGRDLVQLKAALDGRAFEGTLVQATPVRGAAAPSA